MITRHDHSAWVPIRTIYWSHDRARNRVHFAQIIDLENHHLAQNMESKWWLGLWGVMGAEVWRVSTSSVLSWLLMCEVTIPSVRSHWLLKHVETSTVLGDDFGGDSKCEEQRLCSKSGLSSHDSARIFDFKWWLRPCQVAIVLRWGLHRARECSLKSSLSTIASSTILTWHDIYDLPSHNCAQKLHLSVKWAPHTWLGLHAHRLA